MTNVERVERDIAREKMFREAFMNGKEPTDEDRAAWALADAHNQMSLDYARQLDAKEAVTNIKISSEVRKRKKKKGKDDESILENEIFHIMEVSLKEALDMALDDILKEWK
jgi:hypothetical protein